MSKPDDDALVTALDGRRLDVSINVEAETVVLNVEALDRVELTPNGARAYAAVLVAAADVVQRLSAAAPPSTAHPTSVEQQ
jgi:hypothetical protein